MWGLDSRLKENEQKTDKLFKIIQTKENIELGLTRLTDITYKTNFGNPAASSTNYHQDYPSGQTTYNQRIQEMQPAPISYQGEPQTTYNYTASKPNTINSKIH